MNSKLTHAEIDGNVTFHLEGAAGSGPSVKYASEAGQIGRERLALRQSSVSCLSTTHWPEKANQFVSLFGRQRSLFQAKASFRMHAVFGVRVKIPPSRNGTSSVDVASNLLSNASLEPLIYR